MRTRFAALLFAAGCLDPEVGTTSQQAAAADPLECDSGGVLPSEIEVRTADELVSALGSDIPLTIKFPSEVDIDLSDHPDLEIPSCFRLVGTRGKLDHGARLYSTTVGQYVMFHIEGNDIRIEGLRIEGPVDPDTNRSSSLPANRAIRIGLAPSDDPEEYQGRDIVIENNEIFHWTHAAIYVGANIKTEWTSPDDVPAGTPLVGRENADEVMIRRNYLHHNARDGLGYGVQVAGGAYATITRNVFDYNRHAIASTGRPYTGYIATLNYVLDGGYSQGSGYWNQHFDIHGTGSGGYDGVAGEYTEIAYNTFRGAQGYGVWPKNYQRACLMVRGTPQDGAYFHDNVGLQWSDQCVRLKDGNWDVDREDIDRVYVRDNTYHSDTKNELGVGDFDGDGRDDVIVTNGTAWFYSSAGRAEWRYLRNSGTNVGGLAFADIDNDGITDGLMRSSADGYIKVSKSGTAAWTNLTPSTVAISQMRFADFDGDGLTDIFRRESDGDWWIWYGDTQTWTFALRSPIAIDELRFGQFDAWAGTDVVAAVSYKWRISSGGRSGWSGTAMNDLLLPTLADTVVADFDGDGTDDIAHQADGEWRYVRHGRGRWFHLRSDGGIDLLSVQLGDFNTDARTDALRLASDGKFAAWMGLGNTSGDGFFTRSRHTMR